MVSTSKNVLWIAVLALVAGWPSFASAQVGRTVPRQIYYQGKMAHYMGEYRDAEQAFRRALKSSTRIGQTRWIDSICSYSMLGEVYYHRGNLAAALESHELAIRVHMANRGWLSRLRYPVLAPSANRIQRKIGWGQRPTVMGELPESMGSLEGSFDLATPFQIGGTVNPAHMRSVDAVEVARCLAVSLRRRAELLGPTAGLSTLSTDITNSFTGIAAPPGHWVAAWVETFYGLSLMGMGRNQEGASHLAKGRVARVGQSIDHPLTGIALLEIGKYYLRRQEYPNAMAQLLQASLAAARYEQPDIVEEAFRYLNDAFLASEGKGIMPPSAPAVLYAESERFARLAASLRLGGAERAVYSNDPASAISLLNQARVIMARRDLIPTDLGGRLSYLDAITQYRAGDRLSANKSMNLALGYMQRGSLRRFHLTLADALYKAGRKASISPRESEALYSILLREPREVDWRTNPMETITMMLSGHTGSIERWFELLIGLKEYDEAVRVAEHLRRHRFYSTLPFGGRILSLRWIIDGGDAMLGKSGIKRQTELRMKYPSLAKLSTRAKKIQTLLRENNLVVDDEALLKERKKLLDELAQNSNAMENIVREVSLRREPAKLVFPPQPSLKAIQQGMVENQAILMFVTTSKGWHAWFIRKDSDDYWPIKKPSTVRRAISDLLKVCGNRNQNFVLNAQDDLNDNWKVPAGKIWSSLIGELPSNGWDGLDELVVVPDGPLWYLPFELLQVPADQIAGSDKPAMLMSKLRVRYAPVASLSVGDRRGRIEKPKTVVIGGQLFPRESSDHAREMLVKLKEMSPQLEVVGKRSVPQPSRYTAGLIDRLIVWSEIDTTRSKPFAWAPAQYDRGSKESLLSDWIEYPWGAPDQIMLPGFRTKAEANLNSKATGHEIFLAACGLMASGTRTALMSRWRTGGKAPTILVREFNAGLVDSSASEAWRTAVELTRIETIDAESEPRVKSEDKLAETTADHPFFWAGYMLLDTGAEPKEEPEEVEPPADPVAENPDAPAEEVAPDAKPDEGDKANEPDEDVVPPPEAGIEIEVFELNDEPVVDPAP